MKGNIKKAIAWILSAALLCSLFPAVPVQAKKYKVYSQADKKWGSYPYGKNEEGQATIKTSGCGLLALVNAVAYMNGNFIDPKLVSDFSLKNGHRINNAGTKMTLYKDFAKSYGSKYGFSCTSTGNSKSLSKMKTHLQKGNAVVASSTTLSSGKGHIMTIVDYDAKTDKFLILDSYTSSNRFGSGVSSSWQKLGSDLKTGNGKVRFRDIVYLYNEEVTKPAKPAIKSCKALSDTEIQLEWNAAAGAKKYRVVRTEPKTKAKKTIENISGTKYKDTGLKPGTEYYYNVYGVSAAGKVSNASVAYRTCTKPSTPKRPKVRQDSDTQLTVSWEKAAGATAYSVVYHKPGQKWEVLKNVDGKTTSYTHEGLSPGTKYSYAVVAKCVGNTGFTEKMSKQTVSSSQSMTAEKFTRISRPVNKVVSDREHTSADVLLEWKPVEGDAGKTYAYNLYRDGGSTPINGSWITETTYTDTAATSGKIHRYRMDVAEKSGSSYVKLGEIADFYAGPKITKKITLTPVSPTSMKITWDAPSAAPDGVKYTIQKYDFKSETYAELAETNQTSYTDENLTTGETYRYYVQVRDANGNYLTSTFGENMVLKITPETVTLNKSSLTLMPGETFNLEASITPADSLDQDVAWSSSNEATAAVDAQGVVTAKAAGDAEITARTENGKTAVCKITVKSEKCEHIYNGWVTVEASCEEPGVRKRVCTKCGQEEAEPIPASGHSYSQEMQVTKKPTCWEEGEQARVCERCGAKTDLSVLGTTAHTFGAWETSEQPDCAKEGSRFRSCTVCGERKVETIERTEHSYELTSQTEPTQDAPGQRTYTCAVCKDTYTEQWVNTVNEGAISVGSAASKAGTTIKVPVTITDNPGIAGFTMDLKYDRSVLTPKTATVGELLKDSGNFTSNLEQEGVSAADLEQVTVYWQDEVNVTGDGVLFYLEFDISSEAKEGAYALRIETDNEKNVITNQELDDVKPDILDNVVIVSDVLRGDVNQDGTVDLRDAIYLARYLARWKSATLTQQQQKAADVRKDGVINVKDGVRLLQLLVGGAEEDAGNTEEVQALSMEPAGMQTFAVEPAEPQAFSEEQAGERSPQIAVESFESAPGDIISVPVSITGNEGIAGFDLQLQYDSAYLTPLSMEQGDLLVDGEFSSSLEEENRTEDGTIGVHWSSTSDLAEDDILFTVEFQVSENASVGQSLPIEIVPGEALVCDQELNNVNVSAVSGKIEVAVYSEDMTELPQIQPYGIHNAVSIQLNDGTECEEIPANGNFDLTASVYSTTEEFKPAKIIVAAYGADGALLEMTLETITEETLAGGEYKLHLGETSSEIEQLKIFIWDASAIMAPLAEPVTIIRETS